MVNKVWLTEYDKKVPASIDYPPVPAHQFLLDTAAKYPAKTALIYGSVVEPLGGRLVDGTMSYGRLLELTQRFAGALQKLGVKKGDRVAIHLPNCPQFVIAYYATLMCGGIVVPCNPQYVARELRHQLNDSGAKVAVTLSLTYPIVKQIRPEVPNLEHVIVVNIKEYFPGLLKFLFTVAKEKKEGHFQDISGDANTSWFQDQLKGAPAQPQRVQVTPEDTAVLMYTGGTTGLSKGAQLTHRNLVANALQVRWWMADSVEGRECLMTSLPLFHSFGMTVCMNHGVYLAASLILIQSTRHGPHPGVDQQAQADAVSGGAGHVRSHHQPSAPGQIRHLDHQGLHQRRSRAAARGPGSVRKADRRQAGGGLWAERGHASHPLQSNPWQAQRWKLDRHSNVRHGVGHHGPGDRRAGAAGVRDR